MQESLRAITGWQCVGVHVNYREMIPSKLPVHALQQWLGNSLRVNVQKLVLGEADARVDGHDAADLAHPRIRREPASEVVEGS
jgi:hypothetical protein